MHERDGHGGASHGDEIERAGLIGRRWCVLGSNRLQILSDMVWL